MSSQRCRVLITGGGTAGHTNPGIAIAESLVKLGLESSEIRFLGGDRGNEKTLVPAAGFEIDLLSGRGIRRSLSPSALRDNVGAVGGLLGGLGRAVRTVRSLKPDVVVCLGGYAAFAGSAAAVATGTPLVISEQNARASAVNRLFGRFAAVSALPFPDTDLPKGELTGNPIRASVVDAVQSIDQVVARGRLSSRVWPGQADPLTDRVLLAVWAGSLGATRINEAVAGLAERWADRADVAVYHIVGKRDWERFAADRPKADHSGLLYVTVDYENHMAEVLRGSDVALCRAGASTVSELSAVGLPAVLVPLPIATRDHQRANASELVDVGGALLVDDTEVTTDRLESILGPLLDDRQRISTMSEAASSVGRPLAADAVARIVARVGGIVLRDEVSAEAERHRRSDSEIQDEQIRDQPVPDQRIPDQPIKGDAS